LSQVDHTIKEMVTIKRTHPLLAMQWNAGHAAYVMHGDDPGRYVPYRIDAVRGSQRQ
jgi:hypothetical protein